MTKKREMTQMQSKFAENYVKNGFNAYQAALDAGYSESSARVRSHTMLDKQPIRERLDNAFCRVEVDLAVGFKWRVEKLKRLIDEGIPDEGEINQAHARLALAAIAEMNKMYGDYAPDKRLSVTVDATKEKLNEARRQYEEF